MIIEIRLHSRGYMPMSYNSFVDLALQIRLLVEKAPLEQFGSELTGDAFPWDPSRHEVTR